MKLLLLLLLPLTLTACPLLTLIPVLPPGQLGETPNLTGTAANWSGSAKTIKLEVQKPVSGTLEYLGSGTIDAAGKFSIVLPGTTAMNPYLENSKDVYKPTNCPTVKVSPSDVRGSSIVNLAVFDGTTKIGRISLKPDFNTTVGDHYAALLFFNKVADFNVVCTSGVAYNHLHASVGLGWNYDINELYAPNLSHEYVGDLPDSIKWTYAGSSLTNPGQLGETPLLEGNVQGWVGEAATIKVAMRKADAYDFFSSGTIDASGDFRIRLPSGTEVSKYMTGVKDFYGSTCPSLGVTPVGLQLSSGVQLAMFNPEGKQVGNAQLKLPNAKPSLPNDAISASINYFNAEGSVKGTCSDPSSSIDVNDELARGWNVIVNRYLSSSGSGTGAVSNYQDRIQAIPTTSFWTYYPLVSSAGRVAPPVVGRVEGWAKGAAAVRLTLSAYGGPFLGTGNIDAAGNFTLDFPTALELAPYLSLLSTYYSDFGCNAVNIFPSSLKAGFGRIVALDTAGKEDQQLILSEGTLLPLEAGTVIANLVYFDKPTVATGDCNPTAPANAPLNHVAYVSTEGWNWQLEAYRFKTELDTFIADPFGQASLKLKWSAFSTKP